MSAESLERTGAYIKVVMKEVVNHIISSASAELGFMIDAKIPQHPW
ncbi:hypothetical protein [Bacillus sp. C1]